MEEIQEEAQEVCYAVYEADTGNLVSTGTEVADPLPEGLAVKEIPAQGQAGEQWNTKKLAFVKPEPPPPPPAAAPEPRREVRPGRPSGGEYPRTHRP